MNVNLMKVPQEKSGDHQRHCISIHCLGTMAVCTKFHVIQLFSQNALVQGELDQIIIWCVSVHMY